MSKKLTDLQAGALNAWTPAQQAALYHQHMTEQYAKDEEAKVKEILEAEKKEKLKESGAAVDDEDKPDEVSAGKVVDSLIKNWVPPLYDFLDIFGPPHLAVIGFVGLHVLFWCSTPWYLHFLLAYPLQYLIPLYMTLKSVWAVDNNRAEWQCWWVIVALIDYVEIVLFRDGTRGMIWWPKLKLLFCVWMYSAVKNEEKRDKEGKKSKVPVFGSIILVQRWLER